MKASHIVESQALIEKCQKIKFISVRQVYAGNTHLHAKDGLENYIARQYMPPFLLEKTDFSSDASVASGVSSSQSSHGITSLEQQQPLAVISSASSVAADNRGESLTDAFNISPSHSASTNNHSSDSVLASSSSTSVGGASTPTQQRRKRSLKATLSGSRQQSDGSASGRASTPNTPTAAGQGPPSLALDAHIPLGGLVPRSYYLVDAESAVSVNSGWFGGAGADSGPPSSSTPTTDKMFFSNNATGSGGKQHFEAAVGGGVSAASSLIAESGIGSSCYSSPAGSSDCSDEALTSELLNSVTLTSAHANGGTPTKHNPLGLASTTQSVRPSSSGGAGTMLLGHTTKSWVPMHFTNRLSTTIQPNTMNDRIIATHFEPLYVRVLLSRTGEHEVPLEITQPGSIITWDFDVLGSNCRFSVLYLHFGDDNRNYASNLPDSDEENDAAVASVDNLEHQQQKRSASRQPPLLSAEHQKRQEKLTKCVHQYYEQLQQRQAEKQQKQTGKSQHDGSSNSSLVIGPVMPYQERGDVEPVRFVERVDERLPNLKVEKIFEKELCKNGDSIQGTCNAKHSGVYVLRWRQTGDASCVPSTSLMATTFDSLKLSVGSPRCKLMYSVEVITRDSWR